MEIRETRERLEHRDLLERLLPETVESQERTVLTVSLDL